MIKTLSPNSMISSVFLAFLSTAGFFYINIMPALISGLEDGLGYSNQQAGAVGSANMYGAACGALLVIFLVRRIRWRPVACALLLALIGMDLLSMQVSQPTTLAVTRAVHGLVGGSLVGISFSIIARTAVPSRTFGVLLFVQFGLGGLGVMFLPGLVPTYGTQVLFWSLIAFSGVTLCMLPFLPDYPPTQAPNPALVAPRGGLSRPAWLALIAVFTFQAANMGLYAFIIPLARHYGLVGDFITNTLGISAWIGLAGAGLVVLMALRFGNFLPLIIGSLLTVLATAALLLSDQPVVFFTANAVIGVTWAFVISYLLGLAAQFDSNGQLAAMSGFASKMGLASGPALFALILGADNFALIICVAVLILVLCTLAMWYPARLKDTELQDR